MRGALGSEWRRALLVRRLAGGTALQRLLPGLRRLTTLAAARIAALKEIEESEGLHHEDVP